MGDYASDTAHLSLMEHGAYQVLLDTYYATNGQLPAEHAELFRIARAMNGAERKAVKKVADQFFAVNGNGARHNKRADEELVAYLTQADTNRRITAEREVRRKGHEPCNEPLNESFTNRATNRDTNGSTNDEPNQKPEEEQKKPVCPTNGPPSDVWTLGVQILTDSGISEKTARTYLGSLRKRFDDDVLTQAIQGCVGKTEPRAYLAGILKNYPEKQHKRADGLAL